MGVFHSIEVAYGKGGSSMQIGQPFWHPHVLWKRKPLVLRARNQLVVASTNY
jgi:hypothetical protein